MLFTHVTDAEARTERHAGNEYADGMFSMTRMSASC